MQTIPPLLDGRDVLGVAQTGTETAAFALPVLQAMSRANQQNATLEPSYCRPRELAAQIDERFSAYSQHLDISHKSDFWRGKSNPQVKALQKGIDVLVATPGTIARFNWAGAHRLRKCRIFVLDEADQMLDMGFIRDIKKDTQLTSKTTPKFVVQCDNAKINR